MKRIIIIQVFGFYLPVFLILFLFLYINTHHLEKVRTVKLEYVGKVYTEPPLTDFYEKGESGSYLLGGELKEYLEKDLFKKSQWVDGEGNISDISRDDFIKQEREGTVSDLSWDDYIKKKSDSNGYTIETKRRIMLRSVPHKIRWEVNSVIENDGIYYICIGCEIKSLTYIYELQKCANDSSVEFTQKSISITPVRENNVVMIYKGDVGVNNFIRPCVELDDDKSIFPELNSYEYGLTLLYIIAVSVLAIKIGKPLLIDIAVRFSALSYVSFITFMLCTMFFTAVDVQYFDKIVLPKTDLPFLFGISGYIAFLIESFVLCVYCLSYIKNEIGKKIRICVIMWVIPWCIILCIPLMAILYRFYKFG